ncbi:hypothetical protein R1T39_05795 [Sulfitobacter dubius]|nr:hypothetical protein R1T39_05795 [Sulfitobacter dubius]
MMHSSDLRHYMARAWRKNKMQLRDLGGSAEKAWVGGTTWEMSREYMGSLGNDGPAMPAGGNFRFEGVGMGVDFVD